MRRFNRVRRLLGWAGALALGAAVLLGGLDARICAAAEARIGESPAGEAYDAVLVLGAKVYPDGTVSPILADRLEAGIAAYEAGLAPKILLSGDHGVKTYDEVNGMKAYVEKRGIPPEDVFLDHAGLSTYDSVLRAKEVFGAERLLISSQAYHLKRAVFIARSIGLEAWGVPADRRVYPKMAWYELREKAARIKDFVKADLLKAPPAIGGPPLPITGDGRMTRD